MARHSILQQFYCSNVWRNFRLVIITERGLTCEYCSRLIARDREATLHHKVELTPGNVHDVNIALNPKNVILVHRRCHDEIHSRFGHEYGKQVYLVYGPPFSGKSSFVEQQMRRGDIVVDMGRLFEAVSGLPHYDKPDSLLSNVRGLQSLLLDQVKTRYGKWTTAWIIGGYPDKYRREQLADELGAELIFCDCSREEAFTRIDLDEERRQLKADYIRYINEWFERYSV